MAQRPHPRPAPQVVGAPLVRRPLGPMRALVTGLALGVAAVSAAGFAWARREQQREALARDAALATLAEVRTANTTLMERLAVLERSVEHIPSNFELRSRALQSRQEARTLVAGVEDTVEELAERVRATEGHLADALRSSPVYALARARAASAQGRSWLARTGGTLPGLDMDVDSPSESRGSRARASAKGEKSALVRAFGEMEQLGAAADSRAERAEERPQAAPPSPKQPQPQPQPQSEAARKPANAKADKKGE